MAPKRLMEDLPRNDNISNKLLSCLYLQSQSGKFCDIKLSVGCGSILVHSCVLAAFSPYFEDMLKCTLTENETLDNVKVVKTCGDLRNSVINNEINADWSIKHPLEIKLSSIYLEQNIDCIDCASKVIAFMYLGEINISREHLSHIKYLSEALKVSELLVICSNYNSEATITKRLKCQVMPKQNIVNQKTVHNKNTDIEGTFQEIASEKRNHKNLLIKCDLLSSKNNNVEDVIIENLPANVKSRTESKGLYSCSECKLNFPTSALLCKHRDTHLGKLYPCYACRYSTHKAFDLLKHILESEHQEKVCSLCLFEAANSEKLKEHLQQHNHPKPFFCSVCNLRFPTRTALKLHSPKHSTETPFSCSVCSRGFKWKHGLQSHMVIHTTEKKHLCAQCGYSTAHKSTFNAHELVHTGFTYKCPQADCTFKTTLKRNISAHLATHSNEKPYQCEICGQAFSQSKNLRRHALRHDTSALPYNCPLCRFESMRVDKLKYHFKKHHPDGDEKLLNVKRKKWGGESGTKEVSEILLSLSVGEVSLSKEVKNLHSDSTNRLTVTPALVELTAHEWIGVESSENVIQALHSSLESVSGHGSPQTTIVASPKHILVPSNTVKLTNANQVEASDHKKSVHNFPKHTKAVIVRNTNVQNETSLSCSELGLDMLKDLKPVSSSDTSKNSSLSIITAGETNITINTPQSVVGITGENPVAEIIVGEGNIALTVVPSDIGHLSHIRNDSEGTNLPTTETLKQDVEKHLIQTIHVDEPPLPHVFPDDSGGAAFLVTTIGSTQFYSEGKGDVVQLDGFGIPLTSTENPTILMDNVNTIQTILVPAIINNSVPMETSADINITRHEK